jgi:hypothetical protein
MSKPNTPNAEAETPAPKRKYLRTIFIKDSSPVANWIFDELLSDSDVPHAAIRVLLYLIRKTIGWDNREEELSLEQIQYGAGVSRPIAIHALWVVCDCWGLFDKTRGRKGQHSSVYAIGNFTEEGFMDRYDLVSRIYGTGFPTPEQVKPRLPPGAKDGKKENPKEFIAAQLATQRKIRDAEDAEREEKFRRRSKAS